MPVSVDESRSSQCHVIACVSAIHAHPSRSLFVLHFPSSLRAIGSLLSMTGCFVLDTLPRSRCIWVDRGDLAVRSSAPLRSAVRSSAVAAASTQWHDRGQRHRRPMCLLYLAPGQPRLTRGAEPRSRAVARLMPHLARARGWQGQSAGGGSSGPRWPQGEGKFELRLALGACADLGAASCSCGSSVRVLAGRASARVARRRAPPA